MKRRHFAALAAAAALVVALRPRRRSARPASWSAFRRAARPTWWRACWPTRCASRSGRTSSSTTSRAPAAALALAEVKRAAPDGNTLIFSPSGALVIHPWLYQNLGYDTVKDFTPISLASTFDFAVTAGPGAPPGDLKTVLAWMKANPGKANYATSGAGTVPHFAGLLLAPGGRRADDARGLPRRRAGGAGPDRRPGAADGRHRRRKPSSTTAPARCASWP